ncbi:MAG: DEAD/DEAH box helicase family protein [Gammaproteobacteria bacterium]|nr:DEAD/DEAH box helicase family protein [Gammaproteobacteria bacterium]
MTISASNLHKEKTLQDHLVDRLVSGEGYVSRNPLTDYDRTLAMDKDLALRFVQTAQQDAWDKLVAHYTKSAEDVFFKELERSIKERGLLDALRQGIKIVPGIKFSLCHFRPASSLEPKRVDEYQSNILSVMKEVEYSTKCENRIDAVLFLNGLPIVTMEFKNLLTGTTFRHAEKQYRTERSPAGEPLLAFKRGALVHFAVDEDNVSTTTRLLNGKTRFLPFNRGRDGGSGNPDIKDEHRIAYLYKSGSWGEAAFSRSVLLDVIGQFMHLEKTRKSETMIFPRYHQLDAVRKVMAHAKNNGTGNNYLIQHSAGSGKSNTIGWLAHHAINLHDSLDNPVFNTVIIVTDRVVLDRQLQGTVSQFEQTRGIAKKIDGTSRQLKTAIADGARIIVTTIQKFSTEHLQALSGQGERKFAVIVDEAHSSQSGKSAQAMTDALTREATPYEEVEDLILKHQRARGPQANISFLAFTATPRNVTLERFGQIGTDGLPHPFHLYSMRQAIEEDFILDVLQNYMTYKAYYQLEKTIEDDPQLSGRKGQRKVARYASLHPTAIGQKAEIIIEHFRRHAMHEMGGQAKAMVITQSREHALRYFDGIGNYIKEQGYTDLKALVAFSGELDAGGEKVTEASINGFSETELPGRFDGCKPDGTPYPDTYHILVVAEKYQTGFDQPRLCAMYVDKKLSGLQAVQTLSRLNRKRTDKNCTYILDFENSIEDIQTAFKPFYEVTAVEAMSDPNQIYDLERRLFKFGYLDNEEIERFAQTYFKGPLGTADRPRLEGLVRQAVVRFEADDDEGLQEEFRQLLRSFNRFYAFIAQVYSLEDTSLEKLACYGDWLSRLLPNREIPPEIEITDEMLDLQAFRVDKKEEGSGSLSPGDTLELPAISEFGATPYTEDEKKELSEIVKEFNNRHGTDFSEEDMLRFEQVNREIMDEKLSDMLRNNPPDVVYSAFADAFLRGVIQIFQRDRDMQNIILTDPEARDKATRHFFSRALRAVHT